MPALSERQVRILVKKIAQKYGIPRELKVELSFGSVEAMHMAEVIDDGSTLKGFRISIPRKIGHRSKLELLLQHQLAHAKLQSMGFIRATGNVKVRLGKGGTEITESLNELLGFPWEFYSLLISARYFPKESRKFILQNLTAKKGKIRELALKLDSSPENSILLMGQALLIIMCKAVAQKMKWRDVEAECQSLDEILEKNGEIKARAQMFQAAINALPHLPKDAFADTELSRILSSSVGALNEALKDVLVEPISAG